MLTITRAHVDDYETIRQFYHSLINAMADAAFQPGWKKDIYPSPEFLQQSLEAGCVYAGQYEGQIVACGIESRL